MFAVADLYGNLVVVTVVLLGIYFLRKRTKQPPGPCGIPLLGYLPFLGNNPARKYFELSKKYGSVISVKLGMQTAVVLNDFETIHEVRIRFSCIMLEIRTCNLTDRLCLR